jgi:fatty acid desaturase
MAAQPTVSVEFTPTRPREAANPYVVLSGRIREAGLLRRRYGYYWSMLVGVPVIVAGCVVGFVLIGDTWGQLFTAVLFAAVFTQTAFLGHDAAHRQIFKSGRWNDWVSIVIGDLFIGMSYGWWQNKHTRHHARPNQEGEDPDIELPVIAFTPAQAAAHRNPIARWLIAHQGWLFFPILLLEGVSLHLSSFRRVLSREAVDRRWAELALLVTRFALYLLVVFLVLSPDKAVVFLVVQLGLFGFYMGMSFAPNHKGMPLLAEGARLGFLHHQVMMSRNIRGSRLIDVAMGGLNFQIEHHLFPSMARPHLRRAAVIISEFCRTHEVPYTETRFWESYGIVLRYINRVGLGAKDPFECPLLVERSAIGSR